MEIRPHRIIKRKTTKKIKVGKVIVGGDAPISVQSMTNTLTTDVKGTVKQILSLEEAGVDIVRVSCPDEGSTKALKNIIKEVRGIGLLIGLQLFEDQSNFIKKLELNKLLTIRAGENVVRILPPLNVKKQEIDLAVKIIREVCENYN